jgi:hypothetical protein
MQAVERSRRYQDDQKGRILAWKLCREGRFVDDVVVHSLVGGGLSVYRKERGEETINIKHTIVTQSKT